LHRHSTTTAAPRNSPRLRSQRHLVLGVVPPWIGGIPSTALLLCTMAPPLPSSCVLPWVKGIPDLMSPPPPTHSGRAGRRPSSCARRRYPQCAPPFNRQARLVWHSLIRQGSWWKEQEDSVVEKKEGNAEKQWLTVDAVWKCNTCWRLALCRVHRIYSRSHVNVRLQWDFAILC
jgi:hypothetical protein